MTVGKIPMLINAIGTWERWKNNGDEQVNE